MTPLRTKVLGTVLGTAGGYAVLATVLAIRPLPELNTGVIWALPVLCLGLMTAVAVGNVCGLVADWLTRRSASRTPARPTSLADYMPGSTSPQPRVNRAA